MSNRTAGRALTVALLAAGLCSGTGPAGAAPPEDRGVVRSATGYADVFIVGTDAAGRSAAGDFTVFAPQGVPAFGRGEMSVAGYDCLPEESDGEASSVPGIVEGLSGARASGRLDLVCDYHVPPNGPDPGLPTLRGTAVFDLTWIAEGPVDRHVLAGPASSCVSFLDVRRAQVTGTVSIDIAGLVEGLTIGPIGEDDDAIRQETSICHPSRR